MNSPPLATKLGLERTRVAYDRTLMAAIRTGTSLITFGFSVYKFFQLDTGAARGNYRIGPREFAVLVIIIGLFSLVSGTVEYRRDSLRLRELDPDMPRSRLLILVAFVSVLGLIALLAVIFRV